MEKLFVSYEIAKQLKDKGFDNVPCLAVYNFKKEIELDSRETQYYAQKGHKDGILAPLYQQVIDWLDTKNICFDILHTTSKYYECTVFTNVGICTDGLISSRIGNRVYACCEKNRLDAIKKCIEEALNLI